MHEIFLLFFHVTWNHNPQNRIAIISFRKIPNRFGFFYLFVWRKSKTRYSSLCLDIWLAMCILTTLLWSNHSRKKKTFFNKKILFFYVLFFDNDFNDSVLMNDWSVLVLFALVWPRLVWPIHIYTRISTMIRWYLADYKPERGWRCGLFFFVLLIIFFSSLLFLLHVVYTLFVHGWHFQMIDLQIDATTEREDVDFYFNECRDMVTVIQKMLEAGKLYTYRMVRVRESVFFLLFLIFFCCKIKTISQWYWGWIKHIKENKRTSERRQREENHQQQQHGDGRGSKISARWCAHEFLRTYILGINSIRVPYFGFTSLSLSRSSHSISFIRNFLISFFGSLFPTIIYFLHFRYERKIHSN